MSKGCKLRRLQRLMTRMDEQLGVYGIGANWRHYTREQGHYRAHLFAVGVPWIMWRFTQILDRRRTRATSKLVFVYA